MPWCQLDARKPHSSMHASLATSLHNLECASDVLPFWVNDQVTSQWDHILDAHNYALLGSGTSKILCCWHNCAFLELQLSRHYSTRDLGEIPIPDANFLVRTSTMVWIQDPNYCDFSTTKAHLLVYVSLSTTLCLFHCSPLFFAAFNLISSLFTQSEYVWPSAHHSVHWA